MIDREDKLALLKGMMLTRACDNALKKLFLSQEIKYESRGFQGKGFRSLGQEAIYGAAYFLHHGPNGDVAAPLIRDLGVFLCMSGNDCESVINAQAAKSGPPCNGRDLHNGNQNLGLITPAAPLAIGTCTALGMALSFKLKNEARVALSFIGDGGSSLGEWHEAINFAAVLELPMVFCIENNQTALSTKVSQQSKALRFADKGLGYGIKAITIDGNDILAVASAFKDAADHARQGKGPTLIELLTMRMCGHAHHDDMLYLGHEPELGLKLPELKPGGYVDAAAYEYWQKRDPIASFQNKLIEEKIIDKEAALKLWEEANHKVKEAVHAVSKRPWPKAELSDDELTLSAPYLWLKAQTKNQLEPFDSKGISCLKAIALATKESFNKHENCFVIGEDVAPPYGNSFMLYKEIMNDYRTRFINTPISENAIIGSCVGMALAGMRPIGEMQFNDFIACAMDQLVNNAAKTYYRIGHALPMVLRMPYGGLRRAGPFHSQDTAAWFYRVAGLKIIAPSNPVDCFYLLQKAVDDNDPVLFYEHIALYRDPSIRQIIPPSCPDLDGARLVRQGEDITIITYGAMVHKILKIAKTLQLKHSLNAEIIDLRYLKPIDFITCYESIKKTSRVLLFGEDSQIGCILESIAANIAQHCFSDLDAPPLVLGSRNIPVPYSPSLEDDYLLSDQKIIDAILKLRAY